MEEWLVTEGSGWIEIPKLGRINPRRDNWDGGRDYFTAHTPDDGYAQACGPQITEGPETWHYEPDQPFHLRDVTTRKVVEVMIFLLPGERDAVKSRPSEWPTEPSGGGWT